MRRPLCAWHANAAPQKNLSDPYGYESGLAGGFGSADGLREMDSAVGLAADAPEFDFSRARATSQQMYDEQQPPVAGGAGS